MSTIRIDQRLLTDAWEDDVAAVTAAVRAFARRRALRGGCKIVLFELTDDSDLHVNVIHPRSTATPAGWSGPGLTAAGFVHNRRFRYSESNRIARHIQEMVSAPDSPAALSTESMIRRRSHATI